VEAVFVGVLWSFAADESAAADVFEAESLFDDVVESDLLFDEAAWDEVVEVLDAESLPDEFWDLVSDFLEPELLAVDFFDVELLCDFGESELEFLLELLSGEGFALDESEPELVAFAALSDEVAAGAAAAYAGAPSTTIASTNPQKIANRVSIRRVTGNRRARSVILMPVTSRTRVQPAGEPTARLRSPSTTQSVEEIPDSAGRTPTGSEQGHPTAGTMTNRTPCPGRICAARSTSASHTVAITG
jgi:hypothetical protein